VGNFLFFACGKNPPLLAARGTPFVGFADTSPTPRVDPQHDRLARFLPLHQNVTLLDADIWRKTPIFTLFSAVRALFSEVQSNAVK